jgi:hypothetical protein
MAEEKYYLYLVYEDYRTGGKICEGQENESWPSYKDVNITTNFISLHKTQQGTNRFFYDAIEVNKNLLKEKNLYLAIVFYFDGGTFGRTCGYHHIVGLYKSPDEAKQATDNVVNSSVDRKGYYPWVDYFAGLESTGIFLLLVLD